MFLKETTAKLSKPLCLIFRKSLDGSLLPIDWKVKNAIPEFKKVTAILLKTIDSSVVCKVFESIIRENIIGHMTTNDLFAKEQDSF